MPRLSRLRFVSIGHRQARMDDLVLDLRNSDGGAMDSTLWLRNGGGKSSILNLFFALIRPDRREFLGGKAEAKKRRLEDYVLSEDRAVVVAEWELDSPSGQLPLDGIADRLITGVFYEWHTGMATELRRLFFAARSEPGEPALTIDGLPLFMSQNNQRTRRTRSGFRQEWSALRERYPHLQPMHTENLRDWNDYLDVAGIDPELFAYQVRMNQREGGVDEIFRFEEDEQFINFLLELVLDPALGDKVTRNIATYRRELKERKDRLIPERDMLAGISMRLAPLIDLAARRVLVVERTATWAQYFSELTRHVDSRVRMLNAAAEACEQARILESERATEAHQCVETAKRLAAALRLFAAVRRHCEAGERLDRLRRDMERAAEQYQIWDAAVPLYNARRFEKQAEGHRKELERKRTEFAPILSDLQSAALRFAQILSHRITRLRTDADTNDTQANAARTEARQAGRFATESRAREARATSEIKKYEGFIATSTSERERLQALHAIRPEETGVAAAARWASEISVSEQQIHQLTELLDQLREHRQTHQMDKDRVISAAATARSRIQELTERLNEATTARRQLENDATILRCLELESVDIERMPEQVVLQLRQIAREAFDEIIRLAIDRADDDRAVSSLSESGLLPPTRDVERILAHLKTRLAVAWSGWSYIEANVASTPGTRRKAVQHLPDLASGVIVRDPDFAKAQEVLNALNAAPEAPIVIASQSSFERAYSHLGPGISEILATSGAPSPMPAATMTKERQAERFVIGPSTDAHYDRSVAQSELLRRRTRLQAYEGRERQQHDLRANVESIIHRLEDFRRRYPKGWFASQEALIRTTTATHEGQLIRAESLEAEIAHLERDAREAESKKTHLTNALGNQRTHQVHVENYVRQHEALIPSWQDALTSTRQEQSEQQLEAERWDAESKRLEAYAIDLDKSARKFGEEARVLEEELRTIKYIEGILVPEAGPLEEYRDQYHQLKSTYEMNVGAEGLLLLQQMAQQNAQVERRKLAPKLSLTRTLERVQAALDALDDPSQVDVLREQANSENQTAQGLVGQQTQTLNDAAEKLTQAKKVCERLGNIPELDPSELPAGPIQAESDATAADTTVEREEARASAHAEAASIAERDRERSRQAAALLEKDTVTIRTIRETYSDVFAEVEPMGSASFIAPSDDTQIASLIHDAEKAVRNIRTELSNLNEERDQLCRALRAWAGDARFEQLKNLIARQFLQADDADLETHANNWRQQLELRVTTIDAQLSEMNLHRDILITEVLSAAEEGLTLLKSAANQSRLPSHVPGLGGQQFLRITTHEPADHAERRGRIGALIDELLDEDDIPTGLALVQRSVAKLAKPIRVKVLNPDPDLGGVPVDITDMARFSGGEQLTGAILLYCTLAQLRSRTRGQQRKPSGVLILDNPIGRASRVRFLELQREVARAMGIQLIYTTAVNDHEALRTLPNIIRLRNLRFDRNRGHRVLEHEMPDASTIQSVRIARDESPQAADAH
jgi:hypothetical protein